MRSCGVGGVEQMVEFGLYVPSPHITSQPTTQIFKRIFGDCILQVHGAIDFAEVRMRSGVGGVAGFAPEPNF